MPPCPRAVADALAHALGMTPETHRDAEFQPFIDAQRGVFETALQELRAGQKQSHWMWFIFPQLGGLGRSEMARRFALHDLAQARRYLQHPLLGARLTEAAQTAQAALQAGTGYSLTAYSSVLYISPSRTTKDR